MKSVENKYNNWEIYPPRPAWAEIDITKIKHNATTICKKVYPAKVMAVVKADGFGHGLVETAKAALKGGVTNLGVATLDEGIALRRAGVKDPILLMGTIQPRFAELVYINNLTVALCTFELAEAFSKLNIENDKKINVHVKVNTGLNRIGIPVKDTVKFIKGVQKLKQINIEGIFTTFADPDNLDTSHSVKQFKTFVELLTDIKNEGINIKYSHITNSPLINKHPEMNLDLVRVGRLIYGVTPWLPKLKKELGLKSALTIRCEIVFITKVNKGDTIGFDKMYYAKDNMKIATLPIGFADVGRLFHGNSDVIINKTMSNVLSIASDQTLVDVTNIPNIKIGEKVIIIGEDGNKRIDIIDIMARTGLSAGTICTGLTKRLAKIYFNNGVPYRLNGYLEGNP